MDRRFGLALAVLSFGAVAAAPPPAAAQPFTSATQPSEIGSPLVDASNPSNAFSVRLAKSLLCPDTVTLAPITVTFKDTSGSITDAIGSCAGTWASDAGGATGTVDFQTSPTPPGDDPLAAYGMDTNRSDPFFGPLDSYTPLRVGPAVVPFSWTVNGAAGIIARGAVTANVRAGETIQQGTDGFVNICINQHYGIHSSNGRLYCYVGDSVSYVAGWPAAPRLAATMIRVFARRRLGACALDTGMTLVPDLNNQAWRRVRLEVRGLSGHATGYDRVHYVTFNTRSGYGFGPLRGGRYRVSASYPGDPERRPAGPVATVLALPGRCG